MRFKYLATIFLCAVIWGLFIPNNISYASETAPYDANDAAVITFADELTMYQGDKWNLDIRNLGGVSKCIIKSTESGVVSVDRKNYRIKAKKPGLATISVKLIKGDDFYIVSYNIKVKASKFNSFDKYNKKRTKVKKNNKKLPILFFGKVVNTGNKGKITITGVNENDVVSYKSSKPKIVEISKSGEYTATKKGISYITAVVKRNGKKYKYIEKIYVAEKNDPKISDKDVDSFFSKSGFIGNSVSVGLQLYKNTQPKSFMGDTLIMARGSYSFSNDKNRNTNYMIRYNGTPYRAKDAVAKSGIKNVFINMGTNDCMGDADVIFANYKEYLQEIRKENPKVNIYITAMTPVYKSGEKGYLRNSVVDGLNSRLKKYANEQKNMYFIDINTPLKDSSGSLRSEYTSDKYVHLTMAAYKIWFETVREYVRQQMLDEQLAKDAVKTAEGTKKREDIQTAKGYIKKLGKSDLKTALNKRIKNIK